MSLELQVPVQLQVPSTLYYESYDDIDRFISYYHQITAVKKINAKSLLEIGIGNKTVTNYLIEHGYNVTTCDFDGNLQPDHVADIRSLPFEDESFDAVLAFEILEHLPFDEAAKALLELSRVSKRYVLASVPYSSCAAEVLINMRFPRISKKIRWALRMPYFFVRPGLRGRNKEHYWEIGQKGFSRRKVRNFFRSQFDIQEEYIPKFDAYHYFFILTKRDESDVR